MNKKLIYLLLLCVSISACKEDEKKQEIEVSQETIQMNEINHTIKSIQEVVLSDLNRVKFKKEVLPLTVKLTELNPGKYKMINIIAAKISKEANDDVFKAGLDNFKNEFNKLNL